MKNIKDIKLPNYVRNILVFIVIALLLIIIIPDVLQYYKDLKAKNDYAKKIIIPPSISGVPYSVHYDQVKSSCKKGEVQTTITKDKSLKITIECLENLDKIYNKTYQLPNNNILFVNFFDTRQPLYKEKNDYQISIDRQKQIDNGISPIEAKVFNTKTNKLEPVDVKLLEEKEFIYGKSKRLPKNKILVNCKILFNVKNNRFYKISDNKMKPYYNFINELQKEYKNINFIYQFQDSTTFYFADKYTGKHYDYAIWLLEDKIFLKRYWGYLGLKFIVRPKLYLKDKNEVFLNETLLGKDKKENLYSFNISTGKNNLLSNNKYIFSSNNPFIYKNKIIMPYLFYIKIFDLKTKKFESYKISNPNNEPYCMLFSDGYMLFSYFFDKQGYLFNLNTKKTFIIDNTINSQGIKTPNLNLGGFNCFTHSIDPNSLIESDYNLHFMPLSGSKTIISGGGVYCYNDSLYYNVKKSEVEGYNIYNTSIKSIAIEKNNVNK